MLDKDLRKKLKLNKVYTKTVTSTNNMNENKDDRPYGYSVIIPAYKSNDFVEECLNSIDTQYYFKKNPEYEILLGVDCCEDTLKKLLEIRGNYERLRVFYFPVNKGPYITKNTLIQISKYKNLLFFDSDDHMKQGMMSTIDSIMRRGYDICKSKYINYQHGTDPNRGIHKPKVADGVACHTIRVHQLLGGYEPWTCGADSDFCFRSEKHFKIHHINSPMFYRRIHASALTQDPKTNPRSATRAKYARLIESRKKSGYYNVVRKVNFVTTEYEEIL